MDIAGKRILVTGAAGHVGGHIVEQLIAERPTEIIALDRAFSSDPTISPAALFEDPLVRPVEGDITDTAGMAKLIEGIDAVVHTASMLSREVMGDLRRGFEVNIVGTFGLIEASAKTGVKKFILTSSSGVYDGRVWDGPVVEENAYDPASLYGTSKATGEMLLRVFHQAYDVDYVALRCATIYGIRQSLRSNTARLIPESFTRIRKGLPPIIYGDGRTAYDFINVVDVARAHILAIKSPLKAGSFNIASGESLRVDTVVKLISELAGFDGPPEHVPQGGRNNIPTHVFSVEKAKRELGFSPSIPLREGLRAYMDWSRMF